MDRETDNVNQPPGASEDDVLELMHAAMHAYRSLQYQMLRDGPHDLTQMDSRVLRYFDRHPGATLSELALYSGRDKAQLARLIKGLRDRGLLQSEIDENDKRNVRLSLTGNGKVVQRALQQQFRHLNEIAVAGLRLTEHQQLLALLRRVNRNLDAEQAPR